MEVAPTLSVEQFSAGISARENNIVRNVTLKVLPGEVVALVGPSGCGKSTLLKHAVDIFTRRAVKSGWCRWTDSVTGKVLSKSQRNRAVKYIPTKDFLLPHLTVVQALREQARFRCHNAEPDVVAASLIEKFRLSPCKNNRIGPVEASCISSGQRRRLGLALEYIDEPAVMVVDEPTSGVDAMSALGIVQTLRSIVKKEGRRRSVLCVLHQPSQRVFELIDRVGFMAAGRLVFMGTPAEALRFFSRERADELGIAVDLPTPTPLERAFLMTHAIQQREQGHLPPTPAQIAQFARPSKLRFALANTENDDHSPKSSDALAETQPPAALLHAAVHAAAPPSGSPSAYQAIVSTPLSKGSILRRDLLLSSQFLDPADLSEYDSITPTSPLAQNPSDPASPGLLPGGSLLNEPTSSGPVLLTAPEPLTGSELPTDLELPTALELPSTLEMASTPHFDSPSRRSSQKLSFLNGEKAPEALPTSEPPTAPTSPEELQPKEPSYDDSTAYSEVRIYKHAPWWREFGLLFLRHLWSRVVEPGYIRSNYVLFTLLGLLVGAIYWKVPDRVWELRTMPFEPEYPYIDRLFPDVPSPLSDYTNDINIDWAPDWATDWASEWASEWDEVADSSTRSDASMSRTSNVMPPDWWWKAIRMVMTLFWWGVNEGEPNPLIAMMKDGVDGQGSKPTLPNLDGLLENYSVAEVFDCMREEFGMVGVYPDVDNFEPLKPSLSGDNEIAYSLVTLALKAYQLGDFMWNYDWRRAQQCLTKYTDPDAVWLCVIMCNYPLVEPTIRCAKLPPVVPSYIPIPNPDRNPICRLPKAGEERETDDIQVEMDSLLASSGLRNITSIFWQSADSNYSQVVARILDLFSPPRSGSLSPSLRAASFTERRQNEEIVSDSPLISSRSLLSIPSAQASRRMLQQKASRLKPKIEYSWDYFLSLMPMNQEMMTLVGWGFWPLEDRDYVFSRMQALTRGYEGLLQKVQPSECILPICKILPWIPTTILAFMMESVQHTWTALNICGLMFVTVALSACWGIETALAFPDARLIANKDILNGTYNRWSFMIARILVDIILEFFPILILSLCTFYMAGLDSLSGFGFGRFILTTWLTSVSASGIATLCSSFCSSKPASTASTTLCLTLSLLLSGFVLRSAANAQWFKVLGPLSMCREGYAALVLGAFKEPFGMYDGWLAYDFFGGVREEDNQSFGKSIGILCAQAAGFRLVAVVLMCFLHTKVGLKNS